MDKLKTAIKSGRAWNGFHRDSGTIVHLVRPLPESTTGFWGGKALCGTEPSSGGNGWADTERALNCPKCINKRDKLNTINQ